MSQSLSVLDKIDTLISDISNIDDKMTRDGSTEIKPEIDSLVYGYIREKMKEYKLVLPEEIIKLCFEFWFLNVSDEWDKSLCHELVDIDGQCFKISDKFRKLISNPVRVFTVFGCKSIESGIYEWKLRFKTKIEI